MIDVSEHDLNTIRRILAARVPDFEVRAFGSRYRWTAKEYSDLDLAVVGERPPTLSEMANLRADFEDSDLPFRVDVLDWQTISPEFRRVIEDGYEVIQQQESNSSANSWKTEKLGSLCTKIGSGATPRGGKESYLRAGPISLIRSQNVLDFFFSYDGLAFIDNKQADQLSNVELQTRDVLLNITGDSVARVCQVPDTVLPSRVNQHVAIIRPDCSKLIPEYLKYYLLNPEFKNHMLALASAGATRPALTKGMIEGFQIDLPQLADQQRIASILSTLDDKIELNRRMNETLEAIARALFKSWFVDFDPVRAKAEGRQPVGMDAETAALFPDGFEDSELGEIPRGWTVVRLPEIIEVNPNRSLKKNQVAPYLDMANMPTRGHRAIQWIDRPYGSGTRFQNGDTLLARITPCLENGKTAFVDFLSDGQVGWGSTEYIILHPKVPLPAEYGYFLARSDELRSHTIRNMTGTSGRQRAPASCLDSYLMVVAPDLIAQRFGEIVQPIMQTIRAKDEESRTLATIRDTLLPKLISGQVPVTAVESRG